MRAPPPHNTASPAWASVLPPHSAYGPSSWLVLTHSGVSASAPPPEGSRNADGGGELTLCCPLGASHSLGLVGLGKSWPGWRVRFSLDTSVQPWGGARAEAREPCSCLGVHRSCRPLAQSQWLGPGIWGSWQLEGWPWVPPLLSPPPAEPTAWVGQARSCNCPVDALDSRHLCRG